MRALIAFDKFKDAIDAPTACHAAAEGLREVQPTWELDLCPLADGGEGFSSILTRAAGGELRHAEVMGPLGTRQSSHFGLVAWSEVPGPARSGLLAAARRAIAETSAPLDAQSAESWSPTDRIAVVEMAAASGLAQVPRPERNPWRTTSYGTGELLRRAAEAGARLILLGVGGSATNDLGLGSLAALGWRFLDAAGRPVAPHPTPETWSRVARIEPPARPLGPPVVIACDVDNPLLGPCGASAVYGPQKGLQPADIHRLDAAMKTMAERLAATAGRPLSLADEPGAGAAGGIVFGLRAGTQAATLPGFELVQAWLDIDRRLAMADVVLTGEGRFDATSLSGKGPGALVLRALELGKRAQVFAGSLGVTGAELPPGLLAQAISPPGLPLAEALRSTARLLKASVRATHRTALSPSGSGS